MTGTVTSLCCRWMTRRDLADVVRLDEQHYPADRVGGWAECDYADALADRKTIGMVTGDGEAIHGATVYRLEANRINVMKLFGSAAARHVMVTKLLGKLSHHRPALVVRETDEVAIRGCRADGMTSRLVRDHFPDCDGIEFTR